MCCFRVRRQWCQARDSKCWDRKRRWTGKRERKQNDGRSGGRGAAYNRRSIRGGNYRRNGTESDRGSYIGGRGDYWRYVRRRRGYLRGRGERRTRRSECRHGVHRNDGEKDRKRKTEQYKGMGGPRTRAQEVVKRRGRRGGMAAPRDRRRARGAMPKKGYSSAQSTKTKPWERDAIPRCIERRKRKYSP